MIPTEFVFRISLFATKAPFHTVYRTIMGGIRQPQIVISILTHWIGTEAPGGVYWTGRRVTPSPHVNSFTYGQEHNHGKDSCPYLRLLM